MRLVLIATLALAPTAFAQRNLNPIGNNGNVLRPGIPLTGGPGTGVTFGRTPVPSVRNGGVRNGGGRIGGRRSFGGGVAVIPYPVYGSGFDGFYSGGYPNVHNPEPGTYDPIFGGYNPGPAYSPFQVQQAEPTPTVIINQNFQTDTVRPQLRDYSNTPLPEPGTVLTPPAAAGASPSAAPALADDEPTIFLIAMQDHTILPVIAYWVKGDTLNYITRESVLNHVSLGLVDRDFSKQLNRERNVPFALPAVR